MLLQQRRPRFPATHPDYMPPMNKSRHSGCVVPFFPAFLPKLRKPWTLDCSKPQIFFFDNFLTYMAMPWKTSTSRQITYAFLDLVTRPFAFVPGVIAFPLAVAWPLARKPLAREPLAREPLAREPLAREPLAKEPLAWLLALFAEFTDGISILLISIAALVAVPLRFLPRWPVFLYVAK